MISKFTAADNPIMDSAVNLMRSMNYSEASAMLWFYFIIVLAVIGTVLFLYTRYCVRRWE
jgi:hypothetical protein